MQTFGKVYGNFRVPCNETYALAMYMEISMYLAMKHMPRYMEISMYLGMKHMARHMEISMYHATKHMKRCMEITMHLAMKHKARYREISRYLTNETYDETYLAICFVARYLVSGIAKKYTEIFLYQFILAAQRNMEISVDLHRCIKEH